MNGAVMGDFLHHYTSAAGLLGIAQNRVLWASGIRYLNDATEYVHASDIARQACGGSGKETNDEIKYLNYLLRETELGDDRARSEYGPLTFVASLSERADRLSQWRAYARTNGYCIGWCRESLGKLADVKGFVLRKCVYDILEQETLVSACLESALTRYRSRPVVLDDVEDRRRLYQLTEQFEQDFDAVASLCKNEAFEEEQEWRIIWSGARCRREPPEIHVRAGRTFLVPYVHFPIDLSIFPERLDAITQIYCGPTAEEGLAKRAVEVAFHKWGNLDIRGSSVPYRETVLG